MEIEFSTTGEISIKKDKSLIKCAYPHVLFKEIESGKWRLSNVVFTTEEKESIEKEVNDHFQWVGNKLSEYKVITGNQLIELCISEEFQKSKLEEELKEFLAEINNTTFNKDKAIDEAWDVWTVVSNLLQLKGVSMSEFFQGFPKNMDKKISRGYKYGD